MVSISAVVAASFLTVVPLGGAIPFDLNGFEYVCQQRSGDWWCETYDGLLPPPFVFSPEIVCADYPVDSYACESNPDDRLRGWQGAIVEDLAVACEVRDPDTGGRGSGLCWPIGLFDETEDVRRDFPPAYRCVNTTGLCARDVFADVMLVHVGQPDEERLSRALGTGQRLASAFAVGDWTTARAISPLPEWDDATFEAAFEGLEASTIVLAAASAEADSSVRLWLALIAHETRPSGPQTSVYCMEWYYNDPTGQIDRLASVTIDTNPGFVATEDRAITASHCRLIETYD